MILLVCPVARISRDRLLGDRWLIRMKTIETVLNKAAGQFRHRNALTFGLVIEGTDQITAKPRRVVSLHNSAPVPAGGIVGCVLRNPLYQKSNNSGTYTADRGRHFNSQTALVVPICELVWSSAKFYLRLTLLAPPSAEEAKSAYP
jgi:hypothetical protein